MTHDEAITAMSLQAIIREEQKKRPLFGGVRYLYQKTRDDKDWRLGEQQFFCAEVGISAPHPSEEWSVELREGLHAGGPSVSHWLVTLVIHNQESHIGKERCVAFPGMKGAVKHATNLALAPSVRYALEVQP